MHTNNAINVKFNGKYVCISLFFVTGYYLLYLSVCLF